MRVDGQTSAYPSGSGRTLDAWWPDQNGGFANTNARARIFAGQAGNATPLSTGQLAAGTGRLSADVIAGVSCTLVRCLAAADKSGVTFDPLLKLQIRTTAGQLPARMEDPFLVSRFIVTCAFTAFSTAPATRDMGVECVFASGALGVCSDGQNGFGLQCVGANEIDFIARGANGLQRQALTVAPFDVTAFHQYELRTVNSVGATAASVTVLIDGVPVALAAVNGSWAAGTNLPANTFNAGQFGFVPSILNISGNAADNSIAVAWAHCIQAPSLQDSL